METENVWWILYVILWNSLEIRHNHVNCLSYRKEPLHSNFSNCESIASIATMILISFCKENAFDFFDTSEDVNMIILFIPVNATSCWEDLRGTLMNLVILMVLQGNRRSCGSRSISVSKVRYLLELSKWKFTLGIASILLLEKSIWLLFPRRTSLAYLNRLVTVTLGFQQSPWKQQIIYTKGKLVLWLTALPYLLVGAARP